MRHFLGILCIAIRLCLCGACSSEPEPTIKFLGDSEWEKIEKEERPLSKRGGGCERGGRKKKQKLRECENLHYSVELVHIFGYVDASLKHISPTCKQQLEERMKQRCAKPASGAHLSPADFKGCSFICRGTQQGGEVTVEQHVDLRNGTPCGPHGERCYNGECVARSPEKKCHVSFVPYVLFEKGYKETTKKP